MTNWRLRLRLNHYPSAYPKRKEGTCPLETPVVKMYRWGMRMFEGNLDLNFVDEISHPFDSYELKELRLDDILYGSPDMVAKCRHRLDAGECDKLFDLYNRQVNECRLGSDLHAAKYRLIVLAALMMQAGANIRAQDLENVRSLVDQVKCQAYVGQPISDEGFRGPGKVQFLATVDNYKAGAPRDFNAPR
ncbi:hypothetical protein BX600DRAFT_442173 [Xylariales sp. PMI_506]|nr:hypothetical protein BX600DRAFT_442173 [Xylariales sp. PMI_506]